MDFVVEFKLPTDEHLFVRHETNVPCARNAEDAIRRVKAELPEAFGFSAFQGMVCNYGRPWTTVDTLRPRWEQMRGGGAAPGGAAAGRGRRRDRCEG